MSRPTLVFISPHAAGSATLPSRPASLLAAFIDSGAFGDVIVVNRIRPAAFARRVGRRRLVEVAGMIGLFAPLAGGAAVIEHPWPFGRLEARFLRGLLTSTAARSPNVVAWVADPKSVRAVLTTQAERRWSVVLDAYDAWDQSPLVRGDRRRRAVSDGYRAAAAGADLVLANTAAMRDRLASLGARRVLILSNACPPVDNASAFTGRRRSGLVYVGRIHERFDAELTAAVARSLPGTTLTIAGPVEREPVAWSAVAALPNVRLPGRMEAAAAREMLRSAAALLVPHRVDAYTQSQDAMKAWDAIASGTPVISTPIPPVDAWPPGLAEVCPTAEAFVAAARRAVEGTLESGRSARLAFAAANQWSSRAEQAIAALGDRPLPPKGGQS